MPTPSPSSQHAAIRDPAVAPRPLLEAFLSTNDASCPVCAYNLRGLTAVHCPECNAPLSLAVTSENLSVGPWSLAIVSWAMGAGFDGVVALLVSIMLIANPAPIWPPYALVAMFVTLALICLAAITLLVRRRRRWAFKPRATQWRWALACLFGVFLAHAAIGAILALNLK